MKGDKGMPAWQDEASAVWLVPLPMSQFLNVAFRRAEDRLEFGWDAKSVKNCNLERLNDWVVFSDYVMEGFVQYELRMDEDGDATQLGLRLKGTNRDEYIPSHIRFHLKQAGIDSFIGPTE